MGEELPANVDLVSRSAFREEESKEDLGTKARAQRRREQLRPCSHHIRTQVEEIRLRYKEDAAFKQGFEELAIPRERETIAKETVTMESMMRCKAKWEMKASLEERARLLDVAAENLLEEYIDDMTLNRQMQKKFPADYTWSFDDACHPKAEVRLS